MSAQRRIGQRHVQAMLHVQTIHHSSVLVEAESYMYIYKNMCIHIFHFPLCEHRIREDAALVYIYIYIYMQYIHIIYIYIFFIYLFIYCIIYIYKSEKEAPLE